MLKSTIFICIIIQCLISCSLVFCDEDNIIYSEGDINNDLDSESEKDEDNLNKMEDFIDPHSFFYDRSSKKVIVEHTVISPRNSDKISNQEEALKESDENCERFKIYYKRLIKMLLINSNLKMEKDDDLVEGHLFIKGTKIQIEKLKKMETEDYSLKEIDLILSEILLEPSLVDIVFDTINFDWIIQSVFKFVNSYIEVIIIASVTLATIILCRIMPYYRMLFFIIVIGLSVSVVMTYLELVTEAEIKLAAAQVKYIEMPAACQPHKMSLWERIVSFYYDNSIECEKYYQAKMSKPNLRITPAAVLSHLFFTVLLQPVSLFGEAMSKFVHSSTAELPILLQYPIKVLLFLLLPIFMVIGIIFLRGGSIQLGLLRGLNFSFSVPKTNVLSSDDARTKMLEERRTIELIREVIGQLPVNIPPRITANSDLPNALEIKENDSPTDNASDESCKLMSDKTLKELNTAGGDADLNNLFLEESGKKTCECGKSIKINTEIGDGDA